jgi:hypothetical protein
MILRSDNKLSPERQGASTKTEIESQDLPGIIQYTEHNMYAADHDNARRIVPYFSQNKIGSTEK